jgi:titin
VNRFKTTLAALGVAALVAGLTSFAPAAQAASATAPSAAKGLSATPGDTTVALTWTAPTNNGGSAITGYNWNCPASTDRLIMPLEFS